MVRCWGARKIPCHPISTIFSALTWTPVIICSCSVTQVARSAGSPSLGTSCLLSAHCHLFGYDWFFLSHCGPSTDSSPFFHFISRVLCFFFYNLDFIPMISVGIASSLNMLTKLQIDPTSLSPSIHGQILLPGFKVMPFHTLKSVLVSLSSFS